MNAEIISIGDEILIGQIANTNAQWLAEQLNLAGIPVLRISTVGDQRESLLQMLKEAVQRTEVILLTGGLGPTSDDITKPCLCEFFNLKLVFNETCWQDVKKHFASLGQKVLPVNRGQAEIPENCIFIRNRHGTAPGLLFYPVLPEGKGKTLVALPGVPYEMKAMFSDFVIHELKKKYKPGCILHKTVYTHGLGETFIAEKMKNWETLLANENIKLAYLPSPGIVKLRLTASGKNEDALRETLEEKISELKSLLGNIIFSVEEHRQEHEPLEKIIGKLLTKKNLKLSVAESCTGGYIGHLLTSVPGSSNYFKGGIIAYSNEIKIKELSVAKEVLEKKGAVSRETSEAMAEGVRKKFQTDIGIAVTGIAGPAGGTKDKPVGTVWVSISSAGKTTSSKFHFGNDRHRNIQKSALAALNLLRMLLENSAGEAVEF